MVNVISAKKVMSITVTDQMGGWALGCRIDGGQAEYVRVPFRRSRFKQDSR